MKRSKKDRRAEIASFNYFLCLILIFCAAVSTYVVYTERRMGLSLPIIIYNGLQEHSRTHNTYSYTITKTQSDLAQLSQV